MKVNFNGTSFNIYELAFHLNKLVRHTRINHHKRDLPGIHLTYSRSNETFYFDIAYEEFFRFFDGKLVCILHIEKNY